MIELTEKDLRLGAQAGTKQDAIRQVGLLLVSTGHIAPGYIESMLGREKEANTYLGNGIAIPHGLPKDRDLIKRTGIAVLQVPGGVEWNPGETVRLVVGIAARSDEHLGILANLTDVLGEADTAEQLARTENPQDIVQALNRPRDGGGRAAAPVEAWAGAARADVVVRGSGGLHARPATFLVDVANRFQSEVRVQYDGKAANGKALASLLKLGVEGGNTIHIEARGPDADRAVRALAEAVESGLGEEPEPQPVAAATPSVAWAPRSDTIRTIAGIAASPGLAIGPLHQYRQAQIRIQDAPQDPAEAMHALRQAIEVARDQLDDIHQTVKERSGQGQAAIFRAHQALLDDPDLIEEARALVDAGHSAAWSWNHAIEERVADLHKLQDERLAARAADLHDVGQRVLQVLAGPGQAEAAAGAAVTSGPSSLPEQPVILVAEDLSPSDTATLDPKRILGLCTVRGGPTSHTAIIARSLDIPALVGAGGAVLEQPDGTPCILDGSTGKLYIRPGAEDIASAQQAQRDLQGQRDEEYRTRYQPVMLAEGRRIEVVANIGKAAEAAQAVDAGGEGVGLMRTEFLFLGRSGPPTEDEQYATYCEMTRALNGLPLIIRTLDIGGDKEAPYLALPAEANPFLGVRGIRLCLRRPELFLPQLRAIYRAAQTGPIKIMFPMVATLEELREARAMAEQVRRELDVPPVELGIMVEVPSTAMMADEFAAEADFFSVGTNDLTQYTLAMDRQHPLLGKQADGLHPAVLRMIDRVVRAAEAANKWAGVCGGIAGDPRGAIILVGLGVTELSMSIPSIAAVKARLRGTSYAAARHVAEQALSCETAAQVRALPLPE